MIIEGKNPVKEALKGDISVTKVFIQNGLHDLKAIVNAAREKKIRIEFVDKAVLDKMSVSGRHQGVIATADEFKYSEVEDILALAKDRGEELLLIVLDGVEDPHNLGSILRVAECAGAHGIVIPKHRAVSVNETVAKVSAGAMSHVKVARVTNINDTLRDLKDNFVNIVAADMDGVDLYGDKAILTGDIAIVIGGEGNGIKPLTKKLCDRVVSIPQNGKINSLNASVACGVVIFEAVRQRNLKK